MALAELIDDVATGLGSLFGRTRTPAEMAREEAARAHKAAIEQAKTAAQAVRKADRATAIAARHQTQEAHREARHQAQIARQELAKSRQATRNATHKLAVDKAHHKGAWKDPSHPDNAKVQNLIKVKDSLAQQIYNAKNRLNALRSNRMAVTMHGLRGSDNAGNTWDDSTCIYTSGDPSLVGQPVPGCTTSTGTSTNPSSPVPTVNATTTAPQLDVPTSASQLPAFCAKANLSAMKMAVCAMMNAQTDTQNEVMTLISTIVAMQNQLSDLMAQIATALQQQGTNSTSTGALQCDPTAAGYSGAVACGVGPAADMYAAGAGYDPYAMGPSSGDYGQNQYPPQGPDYSGGGFQPDYGPYQGGGEGGQVTDYGAGSGGMVDAGPMISYTPDDSSGGGMLVAGDEYGAQDGGGMVPATPSVTVTPPPVRTPQPVTTPVATVSPVAVQPAQDVASADETGITPDMVDAGGAPSDDFASTDDFGASDPNSAGDDTLNPGADELAA